MPATARKIKLRTCELCKRRKPLVQFSIHRAWEGNRRSEMCRQCEEDVVREMHEAIKRGLRSL